MSSEKLSFCKEKGKTKWKELTRNEMNEYYRIYYSNHKERYTQYKNPTHCDICNVDIKNTFNHNKSIRHRMVKDALQRRLSTSSVSQNSNSVI